MKKVFLVLKRIIMVALIIYTYDVIAMPLKASIPVNFVNIGIVTILGVPSLVLLVVLKLMFF